MPPLIWGPEISMRPSSRPRQGGAGTLTTPSNVNELASSPWVALLTSARYLVDQETVFEQVILVPRAINRVARRAHASMRLCAAPIVRQSVPSTANPFHSSQKSNLNLRFACACCGQSRRWFHSLHDRGALNRPSRAFGRRYFVDLKISAVINMTASLPSFRCQWTVVPGSAVTSPALKV